MSPNEFVEYMKKRIKELKRLSQRKADEYTQGDIFEHFKVASRFLNLTPEQVAFMYLTKHIGVLT